MIYTSQSRSLDAMVLDSLRDLYDLTIERRAGSLQDSIHQAMTEQSPACPASETVSRETMPTSHDAAQRGKQLKQEAEEPKYSQHHGLNLGQTSLQPAPPVSTLSSQAPTTQIWSTMAVAFAKIWYSIAYFSTQGWSALQWGFLCLRIVGPVLLPMVLATVVLSALEHAYDNSVTGLSLAKHTICSTVPLCLCTRQNGLWWRDDYQPMPQLNHPRGLLEQGPWSRGALTGLLEGLSHVYLVRGALEDMRRHHVLPMQGEVKVLTRDGLLPEGERMDQLLEHLFIDLVKSSKMSGDLVVESRVLLCSTKNKMENCLEVDNSTDRGIPSNPKYMPFLASLKASHRLIVAVDRVSNHVAGEVGLLINLANGALGSLENVHNNLVALRPLIVSQIDRDKQDCNVRPWQPKPDKCFAIGMGLHPSRMVRYQKDIDTARETFGKVRGRLEDLRQSCSRSSQYARHVGLDTRAGWTLEEVLGTMQSLSDRTREFVMLTKQWVLHGSMDE